MLYKTKFWIILDVISLTQKLVRFESITPNDDGCLDFVANLLKSSLSASFDMHEVKNTKALHAVIGNSSKKICFLGHVDVVPVCNLWSYPAFEGIIANDSLYGRGVSDMKGAIAAFIVALTELKNIHLDHEIHIVLTADEEGDSIGIKHILNKLPKFDFIIVGEPTNPNKLGEMLKIGRRGSLNGVLTSHGMSGHIAYPGNAKNPIPSLIDGINKLLKFKFEDDSSIQLSSLSTDTNTINVIPTTATAKFNIRFFEDNLEERLKDYMSQEQIKDFDLNLNLSAKPFLSNLTKYHEMLKESIIKQTGISPIYSTTGGTSEGRFFKQNIAEFGLISNQAHKVDEHISIYDLVKLKDIYYDFLSLV